MNATAERSRCPKPGCTQYVTPDTHLDPDYVNCLYHGHVLAVPVPELQQPQDAVRQRNRSASHAGSKL